MKGANAKGWPKIKPNGWNDSRLGEYSRRLLKKRRTKTEAREGLTPGQWPSVAISIKWWRIYIFSMYLITNRSYLLWKAKKLAVQLGGKLMSMCKFKFSSENTKIFNSQENWITLCANDNKWMLQSDSRNQLEAEANRDCTDWEKNKD